jgi:hypothetical protein
MQLTKPVVAVAGMLIRKPAHDCYEAFVDPAIPPISGSPNRPADWIKARR